MLVLTCLTRAFSTGIALCSMFVSSGKCTGSAGERRLALGARSTVLCTVMLSTGLNEDPLQCSTDGRCGVDKLLFSNDFSVNDHVVL